MDVCFVLGMIKDERGLMELTRLARDPKERPAVQSAAANAIDEILDRRFD
jgi:hypothetical protein